MATAAPKESSTAPDGSPAGLERKRKLRSLWWREAMLSPWTPVVFLGLALLPYIMLVEFHTPAHLWARPILKAFALGMVFWVLGLFAYRALSPKHRQSLRARHQARELLGEVRGVLARCSDKLDPKILQKVTEAIDAVEERHLQEDIPKLESETVRLAELAEKHLSAWRPNRTFAFITGIAKALAIALAIRTALIEPYRIPSGSMIPTLEIGDQIFINKFIYGVRIPFTNWVPFVIVREPERGDIAVFENPIRPEVDLVKRIVAVGGDKVAMKGKQLFVNGQPLPTRQVDPSYVFYDVDEQGWNAVGAVLLEESLDGKPHPILHIPQVPADPPQFEATVPPRHVFVMGDNRDNSADSRHGLGERSRGLQFVPYGHLKGKAMIVWLALGHDGLGKSLFGGTGLRTERLFLPIR